MAKPTDLIDPFFRTALVEAEQALDAGDYLGTVRKCVEVYSRIAAQRPEMILRPPNELMPLPRARSVREGRRNALLPWPVDAVTVAVPTESHLNVALPFLERGIAVLVEKPLARNAGEAGQLIDAAAKSANSSPDGSGKADTNSQGRSGHSREDARNDTAGVCRGLF